MKIDGHTKIIGIFGWPLTYTRSPIFQNAGLKAAGVNAAYLPLPVKAADFPALWRSLSKLPNFIGANVTNPHKQAALKLADRLTPEAKAIGAVNTLFRSGKAWVGHNTDAGGFLKALPMSPKGRKVLLFGAGGAARAIVYSLLKAGAAAIVIACRRPSQGRKLLKTMKLGRTWVKACGIEIEPLSDPMGGAEIIINTIPGADFNELLPQVSSHNRDLRLFFDANYAAKAKGLRKGLMQVNGLGMLLEQGCLSFECWTGKRAPKALMRRALGH